MTTPLNYLAEDERFRRPLAELLSLALPTVAQMASYTVMQFLDTWMLAKVGVDEVTAAGNAGILAWAFLSLGVGTMFVVNTLVSQAFGRRDDKECGRYLWQGMWVALAYALVLLPLLPLLPRLFELAGHEPRLVSLQGSYLRITLAFGFAKLAQTAVAQFLLAIDRPGTVLLASVCGVCVNALFAWVTIFGHFGAPRLGVVGAAWAQNVGGLVELLVALAFAARPAIAARYNVFDWRPRWDRVLTLLRIGLPSGLQTASEVFAWSIFCIALMGQFHTEAMAATIIAFRYMSVSFMPAFGTSTAVTALVGRYIGRGRPDVAARRAHLGFVVTLVYMLSCGLAFLLWRHEFMAIFSQDPGVQRIGAVLLIFAAAYQLCDALYIIYYGGLRGAGDTLIPALVTAGLCWGMLVGGGAAVVWYLPHWGVIGPWAIAGAYGVILGAFMVLRFHRGRWRGIHLEQAGPPPASNAAALSATVPDLQLTAGQ